VISNLHFGRITLKPISKLDNKSWRKVRNHFRDPEIAHLNGTRPNGMPLWILRRVLKADSRKSDRETFGIFHKEEYIGTIELYDIAHNRANLGIIIGERDYWDKGFGPEAIMAILEHAFIHLGLQQVFLRTYNDNKRAQNAFKKAGFKEVRRFFDRAEERVNIQMKIPIEAYLEKIDRIDNSRHESETMTSKSEGFVEKPEAKSRQNKLI